MSLNDFEFGKELGKGAFGSVSIVKRLEDNKIYAMKRVKIGRLGKKEKDNSFNEVRLLASLDHKNIIGYKEAFFDDRSKTLNIVMEYAEGGDLSTKIKEIRRKNSYFEEETIWSTLIQILEGLKYLHQSCIIHRDLKSANIFLTKNGCVKIGDLNVSKILNRMRTASTQTGTPYFASPEIWNDQPYDYKCDIWSVGCIIYEMASLNVPFRGTSMQNLYQNVLRGIYQQIPLRYSDDLRKIIKQILIVNPKYRPSSSELLENPIIKRKIIELGLNKDSKKKNEEKARLMKTIKIPMNMSQINNELPQKKYEKEKMLLNDEYETAKRTFYHPPTIIKDENNNEIDKNDNNQKNNENNINSNININKLNDKQIEDKNFVEQLLEKDLNNIQNIIKNLDNNNCMRNNFINNNISKNLKNIDNNEEENKKLLIKEKRSTSNIVENRHIDIGELNPFSIKKYPPPKIKDNNICNQNKYSNINYDYILNEQDNINRIIKTDMNQVNSNNKINLNIPPIKNDDIIKTEISNIETNFKNNNISQTKENNNINNINSNISETKNNDIIDNNKNNNQKEQDKDFKEKYNKLMEELKLKEEKEKVKEVKEIKENKEQNRNNIYFNNININNQKKKDLKNIDEEILKSKKELEEIDRNLHLLEQKSKQKKELKYNKNVNLLNNIYNTDSKNNIMNNNLIEEKSNFSGNKNTKKDDLFYRQNQIKKINKKIFDSNFKNIRNNRQEYNKHNISLRPIYNNDFKNDRSSLKLENKSHINNINKYTPNINEKNKNNNNNTNRYNIFINYKNRGINNYNNNYNYNYNQNYYKKNNYYFNNCNFINNNINYNNNYHNKYNNLLNPYNNNNNYYYNNYNQFYKDFINHLSLKKLKEEKNRNNKYNNDTNTNNNNKNNNYEKPYIINHNKFKIDEINENNKRKVIYEKINFHKQGDKYEYFKGPAQIRYVGNGNYYNQCHKAVIKNPVIIIPAKQYGIQNLLLSGGKPNRNGPRIILPKNMFA